MGHAMMENRNGLAIAGLVTLATGTAERLASERMLKAKSKQAPGRITVGEDKACDTKDHIAALRSANVTPHVTQNDGLAKSGRRRKSAIDAAREMRPRNTGASVPIADIVVVIVGMGLVRSSPLNIGALRDRLRQPVVPVAVDEAAHSRSSHVEL